MCVKLSSRGSNSGPYPPYPTSTYICAATIVPRVCGGGGNSQILKNLSFCENQ